MHLTRPSIPTGSSFSCTRTHEVLRRMVFALVFVLGASAAVAQGGDTGQDLRGSSIEGGVTDRDNTRVQGTVFDSAGQIMPDVQIWGMNHNAPATRLRARTRKTGSFLLRNFGRIYERDDVYGLTMRVQFEKPGYRTVEVIADVQKNGITRIFPILFKEGQDPSMTGICTVLTGTVTNAKGKPIKGAKIKITADGFEALAETKGGEYEVVLWNAPQQVTVDVESSAGSHQEIVDLQPAPRPDVFLPQTLDVSLGG